MERRRGGNHGSVCFVIDGSYTSLPPEVKVPNLYKQSGFFDYRID
jgi:hypothetical protein